MVQAALASGHADRRCVFETFARRLPDGRRYGVVAGTGRVLESLRDFRFGEAELAYLEE
ncbi:MAG: nicotinate phosphoribosyltransferase, partial [Actinomycetes bacterium]|nr:nicotinate phosphoribosyltransferase [Actinomycetes bacterium]